METKLDKFGRIVIPRKLRRALGLKPGAKLHIETVNNSEIHLKPMTGSPDTLDKNGWLVFSGILTDDVANTIDEIRQKRIDTLAGTPE